MKRIAVAFAIIGAVVCSIMGPAAAGEMPVLTVSAVSAKTSYAVGDTVLIALRVGIPSGFHLYSNPMGPGIGKPLQLSVDGSGVRWINARKQTPVRFDPAEGDWVFAWEGKTILFVRGIAEQPGVHAATITLDGLICDESCIPMYRTIPVAVTVGQKSSARLFADNADIAAALAGSEPLALAVPPQGNGTIGGSLHSLTLPKGGGLLAIPADTAAAVTNLPSSEMVASAPVNLTLPDYKPREPSASMGLLLALFFAFIAGIILNAMPCVLPVLGIKVISLAQGAAGSRRKAIGHALAFTAGMLAVFLALATLAAFAGFSWGDQFQKPAFVVGIIAVIAIFALGMFDLFQFMVPSSLSNAEDGATKREGFFGDFFKGVFATLLATPCSGPFLGATLAWTLTQSVTVIYLVFLFLGLGMAFPYIILTMIPGLARLIPRPGAWMEDFKRAMGFLLLGFAVYLLVGLPGDLIAPTVGFVLTLAIAVVAYGRIVPFGSSLRRTVSGALAAGGIIAAGYILSFDHLRTLGSVDNQKLKSSGSIEWVPYSETALAEAHAVGRNVMIDFTANWCMNCQYNKLRVYHSPEVAQLIREKNILVMEADFTGPNPPAELLRNTLGSRSIPFLAVFPGTDPAHPYTLRDIVKKSDVVTLLKDLPQ